MKLVGVTSIQVADETFVAADGATVAAVLADPARFAGKRVGVILSGGNVDLDALPWAAA